jgi:uncharacterized protein
MSIAVRRFFFLLIVGIFHAFFVWHGDILINYALCGMLLLLFLKGTGKGMVIFGILLSVISNLLFCLLLIFANTETNIYSATDAYQSVLIYQQGSFIEITKQRIADWYAVNNPLNSIFLLFSILPFFLIGGGAAKFKWAERAKTLRRRFVLAFFLFFVIGLFIKTMPYVFGKNLSIEYLQNSVGGPFLAVAYALGIVVLTESDLGRKCFSYLAPVGMMSISNYLFQSVLSTWIFYSYGFGLYGKISIFAGTVLALFIYVFQVYFSNRWLTNHYFGPVEWLWRSITYKKKQPWKRVAA